MEKNIFVCLLMTLFTSTAFAAQGGVGAENNAGTVHFTGEIIEPSCVIVGDSGTAYNVPLGTYPTSYFSSSGKESDIVPLTITLKECPVSSDGLSSIQLTFKGTTVSGSTNILQVSQVSTTGPATAAGGVGVVLSPVDEDTTLITFDEAPGQVYIPLSTNASDTISATFDARYKSYGTVTAGAADAELQINILYK
ncbi:fimbrial protein [Citrobacter sp. NCU1]|uniref:fimbrial protein n=1 Tax=Citrobacter sp. NCU1 TaxID=2026683 RepID=UPI00313C1B1B